MFLNGITIVSEMKILVYMIIIDHIGGVYALHARKRKRINLVNVRYTHVSVPLVVDTPSARSAIIAPIVLKDNTYASKARHMHTAKLSPVPPRNDGAPAVGKRSAACAVWHSLFGVKLLARLNSLRLRCDQKHILA